MDEDLGALQAALRKVERDIETKDDHVVRLRSEIGRMEREILLVEDDKREDLGGMRYLRKKLGLAVEEEAAGKGKDALSDELLKLIPPDAFKGLHVTEATVKCLRLVGHGLTHGELVQTLLHGKVTTSSARTADTFRTALARRKDLFVVVREPGKRPKWELVEWKRLKTEPVKISAVS